MVDVLALALDNSQERMKVLGIMSKALGISQSFKTMEDVLNAPT